MTVFDASYRDLGAALSQQQGKLPKMSTGGRWNPGAIHLIDVTVSNVSGLPGIQLPVSAMRALFYVRLVQNGLALASTGIADVDALATAPKDLQGATKALLAAIPARGSFSTRSSTPAGKTDLAGFLTSKTRLPTGTTIAEALAIVDDNSIDARDFTYEDADTGRSEIVSLGGLSRFVRQNNLDMGHPFDLKLDTTNFPRSAKKPDRSLLAHHWIPAELAHEALD